MVKAERTNFQGRKERSVAEMYDQDDLSACSLFAGNFINFGFWPNPLPKGLISPDQRIESKKNLYRAIAKKLSINKLDKVLEVACGQGVGSVLLLKEFQPQKIHGIDFSAAQIARAKKINADQILNHPDRVVFQHGEAENIPYPSQAFDKVFSIEAAQHFSDIAKFISEASRVLKPKGKLAIATFFGTSEKSKEYLSSMIQTIHDGIDKITPIDDIEEILNRNRFKNIRIESIGSKVWPGFDQWTAQGEFKDSWTRNWYKGYKMKLIDYYLITAKKAVS